ncbi:AAA family ATPase [Paenibacillus sp. MMS18-CY102]|uniref:AAA family ATPase n=1 Tax=Paenibacillus sp. MMS18-CY102 TaxID=2682849 RepID=UPI001365BF49|nr:AAA family ATPase [Paenibacillus sp. MMS18-CY102]MWC30653.1 AAA family ATPase [Paenibacillus sp. MMS18-CY102]
MATIVSQKSTPLTEPPKFFIGESNFTQYMLGDFVYVDKTLFLKKWWTNGAKVSLIVRPRRFSKTTVMSMVDTWFKCTDAMFPFIGTQIMDEFPDDLMNVRGTVESIFMTFKDIHATSWQGLYSGLSRCFNGVRIEYMDEYREYKQFFSENEVPLEEDYESRITFLLDEFVMFMRYLSKVKDRKLIILIDEYDKILMDASSPVGGSIYFDKVLAIYRNFLNSLLKDTPFVERAILTGVLPLAANSVLSAFNNAVKDSFLAATYEDTFGFTPEETDVLTSGWMKEEERSDLNDLLYGYTSGNSIVYNPWSVINRITSIANGDPSAMNTWSSSGNTDWIEYHQTLNEEETESVSSLLMGELVTVPINHELSYKDSVSNFTNFLTYAFYTGYLSFAEATSELVSFRVPNKEVLNAWIYNLNKLVNIGTTHNWATILDGLNASPESEDELEAILHDLLDQSGSYWDIGVKENAYHLWILGLMCSLTGSHKISSNREAGAGRFDIAVVPLSGFKKARNYVFELKQSSNVSSLTEDATMAVKQVKDNRYYRFFENDNDIVIIGLSAFRKELDVKIEICKRESLIEHAVKLKESKQRGKTKP